MISLLLDLQQILITFFLVAIVLVIFRFVRQKNSILELDNIILNTLQHSKLPWCVLPLNHLWGVVEDKDENEVSEKESSVFQFRFPKNTGDLICSEAFKNIIGNSYTYLSSLLLEDLIEIMRKKTGRGFEDGVKKIIQQGGEFFCDISFGEESYLLVGELINIAIPGKSIPEDYNKVENFKENSNSILDKNYHSTAINFKPLFLKCNSGYTESQVFHQHSSYVREYDKEESTIQTILITLEEKNEEKSLQSNLEESEKTGKSLYTILNTVNTPVWARDERGQVIFFNEAYKKFFQTKVKQHAGSYPQRKILENFKSPDTQSVSKNVLENSRIQPVGSSKEEKEALLEILELPVPEQLKNNRVYTVGFAFDVSHYKAQQEIQYEKENSLKSIVEYLNVPFVVFDKLGSLILYSEALKNLFGFEETWLKENNSYIEFLEFLKSKQRLPEYINLNLIKNFIKESLQNPSAYKNDIWHLPNGEVLSIEMKEYLLGGVVLIFKDITEILNIESKYKSMKSVCDELINKSLNAVLLIGMDHKVKNCSNNLKEITGFDPSEVLEKHIKIFVESFAKRYKIHSWREVVLSSIELRNSKSEILQLSNETSLICNYVPLPGGDHLLTFSKFFNLSREKNLFSSVDEEKIQLR